MATYFLDTSAIIKRYIFESGQAWVLSLQPRTRSRLVHFTSSTHRSRRGDLPESA